MADDDPSCGTAGPERKKKSGSAAEPAQKVHPDCRTSAYPHIFPFLPVIRGSATLCYRCKTNKPSAVFRDQSWCNECHQNSVNLRFRLGLRTIQHQQAGNMGMGILVAYSGGTCSTALLDLVNEYMVPDGMRPRKFTKLVVCHVDETAVLPLDEFNLLPDEIRMSMDNVVKSYPAAKFVRVPLEAVFEDDEVEKELLGLERLSLGSGGFREKREASIVLTFILALLILSCFVSSPRLGATRPSFRPQTGLEPNHNRQQQQHLGTPNPARKTPLLVRTPLLQTLLKRRPPPPLPHRSPPPHRQTRRLPTRRVWRQHDPPRRQDPFHDDQRQRGTPPSRNRR